jgi:hypothetical protein
VQARAPEYLALDRQATPLIVVQAKATVTELFPEDAVLLLEIGDDVLLLAVDPARGEQDDELRRRRHGGERRRVAHPRRARQP